MISPDELRALEKAAREDQRDRVLPFLLKATRDQFDMNATTCGKRGIHCFTLQIPWEVTAVKPEHTHATQREMVPDWLRKLVVPIILEEARDKGFMIEFKTDQDQFLVSWKP